MHPKSTVAVRTVSTRRMSFEHDLGSHRRYFDRDLLASHLVATLSGVIPAGERFVAEAVKRYRKHIDEPHLAAQANAFVGQEFVHQREHDRFNRALAKLGYPTAIIDRSSELTFALLGRLPRRTQVAMTSAIEHWTAVIAEHVLTEGWLDERDLPSDTREFLGWHLVEELEHKAVAFDTMQSVGTTEAERIAAMALVVVALLPSVAGGMLLSLALDPTTRSHRHVRASMRHARPTRDLARSFRADLLAYLKPGFHPDERSTDDMLERWRNELLPAR